MIEKMKFISITGPKYDIDRVVNIYLSKHEIHLENALAELSKVQDIRPFVEVNPYKEILSKSNDMVQQIDAEIKPSSAEITPDRAVTIIQDEYSLLEELTIKIKSLKDERTRLQSLLKQIEPFRLLNYDLRKILHFNFIKYRFGRITHEYYNKFYKFIYDNLNTVFYECDRDQDYIWGVYFVPSSNSAQVDAIYSSLHFERVIIPDEYEGTPEEAYKTITSNIDSIESQLKSTNDEIKKKLNETAPSILAAHDIILTLNRNFDVRKLAALTKGVDAEHMFYILCGWMATDDCLQFLQETKDDKNITVISDETGDVELPIKPPTKLKNPKIFKPFEIFIKMYGLPAYNEIDPTIFVALTYSFIFGAMFGDVGQGICLVTGGYLLAKYKKMDIAAIVSVAGIFSTIFGFLYGSVFGYEHILPALWLKPMNNVMTVLIVAVGLGVLIIFVSMILNIINAIKLKDAGDLLFGSNGIAGFLFYLIVVGCVVAIFMGYALPGSIVLTILLALPLLAIYFKDPLSRLLERKKAFPNGGIGMFFIEALVELFDVVLTYATNTISFLRVGAFALSHAGMMGVVIMLAGAETGGHTNWIIIILGNILVAGMEGLIVGIQVLRLEYYEMFGRFYRGTGKEFKPFKEKKSSK
ncbi:V-type ATP synthase subunit I [Lachnospiraceae bacterium KM106-2]|nr:V-type ATP synthase subunit I [Lachnospiraceae bacterium KM106-2]